MRKIEIVLIVVVAITIAVIFGYTANASTYGNFTEAFNKNGSTFTVVGELNKEVPVEVLPKDQATIFYMVDKEGKESKVILNQIVPEHFDRSDNVVITGKANTKENTFMATDVQLKCPSKYNDEL